MGFVKTAQEVAGATAVLGQPRFVGAEMLSVDFLTRWDVVDAVLPPGFERASQPRASVKVGRWRSNVVGDYSGGALYVMARYQGIEAPYVLAMYMDAEPAVTFGSHVLGEPKKLASSRLYRRGNSMHGFVERAGVRLIDIRAVLDKSIGPATTEGATFNIKARPATDGTSCEEDAVVTLSRFRNTLDRREDGTGNIVLRSGPHDPCGDIAVVEVLSASYVEGDLSASASSIGRIDKHLFFPYLLGRMDDWSLLSTEHDIPKG